MRKKRKGESLSEFKNLYGDDVVYITIPKDKPVLVFKHRDCPFWFIVGTRIIKIPKGKFDFLYEDTMTGPRYGFVCYWKGRRYENEFPKIVAVSRGKEISKIVETHKYTQPDKIFEMSLDAALEEGQFKINRSHKRNIREGFRGCGVLEQRRGKYPRDDEIIKIRKRFVLNKLKRLGNDKPVPYEEWLTEWQNNLWGMMCPQIENAEREPQTKEEKIQEEVVENRVAKYKGSKTTFWRIIKSAQEK